MTAVYLVCEESKIDPATQQCTEVQYVQAPTMIPPLSAQAGAELGTGLWTVWVLAACWKTLRNF